MQAIASLVFAVVPILLYLWAVWEMDRYDREPLGLLVVNFLWGALGAVLFGIVFSIIASVLLGTSDFLDTIFVAPFIEEITKGVFLFWTVRKSQFDNITDGVVYGMAIGLGFGMTENFLYFLSAKTPDEWVFLVIIRTLFSAVMHAMATGLFGAFVGLTKFNLRSWKVLLRMLGLGSAMFIHFMWNYSVSINDPATAGLGALFIFFSVIMILVTMQVSLLYENRLIRKELTEESDNGILPAMHLQYIPYTSKRKLIGWLPPSIDKKKYIQLTTKLAFRKSQLRQCKGRDVEQYTTEVEGLRSEIRTILETEQNSNAAQLF